MSLFKAFPSASGAASTGSAACGVAAFAGSVAGGVAPPAVFFPQQHFVPRAAGVREVVGEAVEGREAIKKVGELRPDIVLLDISLPDIRGIDAAPTIREVSPESRIIFVSQHTPIPLAKDALQRGANGYVVKSDTDLDLLAAIEAANQGSTFVSRTLRSRGWTSWISSGQ